MIRETLKQELQDAIKSIAPDMSDIAITLSHPDYVEHGDFATSIALALSKKVNKSSQELAQEIVGVLGASDTFNKLIKKTEVAGPGFINFFLSDITLQQEVKEQENALAQGYSYMQGTKLNIEFLSANPTGRFHIGHGRGVFYGDVLGDIYSFAGADVTKEYYINNSKDSNQIKELGKTVLGLGEQYKTEWLEELLKEVDVKGFDEGEAGLAVAERIQEYNQGIVEKNLGVHFNVWYSEDEKLRESGKILQMLDKLREGGHVYEKDGAHWLETEKFGDDKDRVLVRSDGSMSYFVSDIAYHDDKFARGFNPVINVWGADHQGHVKRMHAVGKMLNWGEFNIHITQMVTLQKDGLLEKMSKRAGNVIYLEDMVSKFGLDVVRWFFLERSLNHHIVFDEDSAREQSDKNPVYYVQYAHARMVSVSEKVKGLQKTKGDTWEKLLDTPSARALAVRVTEFPEVIEGITVDAHVHALNVYLTELTRAFSTFYHDVYIINEQEYNAPAHELLVSTQKTLAKGLELLGISAPEKM